MHAAIHGERTLTDLDFGRLSNLLGRHLPPGLADLLACAEVTSSRAIPCDVVTMYSQVELVDVHTRRRQTLTVCYPGDAEPAAGYISVLSPVGNALLGMKLGEVARWYSPTGEQCCAEISAMHFQPEATGDYVT
ncbi:regulator of nucleoside diphosphate kinase [Variovorax sp. OK605]|jgi:regulator of nucleoside diphosphate kinase|uniref:GreA/GreB family elongation factor n=1 Tax=unclassified Variovorax TaxID=663243 RepID=UPI0008BB18A2|nr:MULTISPECIES: GreA/GreB family elongation factor [unclassified Variovorax]SEK10380.1 regulator of nucleoside diphosphate kinase [Variovorax sp. OK202]SFD67810.1 regulator of nucleoside diphosphate kinase [Variovorax sp. OK212]SFQ10586.1 regulator of nucleoside diphosphate kinase [Variovorax sp. OK605]